MFNYAPHPAMGSWVDMTEVIMKYEVSKSGENPIFVDLLWTLRVEQESKREKMQAGPLFGNAHLQL